MNLVLFPDAAADTVSLPGSHPVAQHISGVLKMGPGDTFDIGALNGPRGKARIIRNGPILDLELIWGEAPTGLLPLHLLVGLSRPQTARKVLQSCTSMGIASITWFQGNKGDPAYGSSKLWRSGEWLRHLWQGAEQAFTTRIPHVSIASSLEEALHGQTEIPPLPPPQESVASELWNGVDQRLLAESAAGQSQATQSAAQSRLALDVYEAETSLASIALDMRAVSPKNGNLEDSSGTVLAVGPERGWGAVERNTLRKHGFKLAHLGENVLRVETACIAALSIVMARRGYFDRSNPWIQTATKPDLD